MPVPTSDHWAHLTYLESYRKPIMATGYNGEQYVADTHGPLYRRFRCDCGHEFEMPANEFPGRRHLKSCGRKECLFAPPPRLPKAPKPALTIKAFSLTQDMASRGQEEAFRRDMSYSAFIEELLREYFLKKLVDE